MNWVNAQAIAQSMPVAVSSLLPGQAHLAEAMTFLFSQLNSVELKSKSKEKKLILGFIMHQRHLSLLVNKYRLQCHRLLSQKRFPIHQEPNISKRNPESLRKTNPCGHKHYKIYCFAVIYSSLCNFEFQSRKHYNLYQPYSCIFALENITQKGSFMQRFIFALKAHHSKENPH